MKINSDIKKYFLRILWGTLVFCTLATIFYFRERAPKSTYGPIESIAINENGEGYVSSLACMECHPEITKNHLQTAHFNSSSISDTLNVLGSFEKGKNLYDLNELVAFNLVEKQNSLFQEAFTKKDSQPIYSLKFDITIGSGSKGQSYLTWIGDGLYQQQISYYTPTDSWINSPLYPKNLFVKPRPVVQKCIGCHATFAKPLESNPQSNRYSKSQMVYGIDCERCHGPAADHVNYHLDNPEIENARFLGSFQNLNRQKRLDACALCHSGLEEKNYGGTLKFEFGQRLDYTHNIPPKGEELDVHGNQYGLLIQSECFKKSENMDCITCHNPHKKERGNSVKFNAICIECHSEKIEECQTNRKSNVEDCITCHMPVSPSKSMMISSGIGDSITPLYVRTHLIKRYIENL